MLAAPRGAGTGPVPVPGPAPGGPGRAQADLQAPGLLHRGQRRDLEETVPGTDGGVPVPYQAAKLCCNEPITRSLKFGIMDCLGAMQKVRVRITTYPNLTVLSRYIKQTI